MIATTSQPAAAEPADRVLVITRIFNAPPPVVFATWTDANQLVQWWGPRGFQIVSCNADVRVGGASGASPPRRSVAPMTCPVFMPPPASTAHETLGQ